MLYQLLKDYIDISHKRKLKRGEIIYHEGDNPESLFFIDQGMVGLFHISETGKETFLRVFNKDYIFGHRSYFAETPYHATSMALIDTELTIISKSHCQQICLERPDLLKEITKVMAQELGHAELRLAGLQDKTANQRIIESLIYLKLKHPDHVWTRKEVAEYSGSTLESVTRIMTKLNDQGLIKKKGRDFDICDPDELMDYAKSLV